MTNLLSALIKNSITMSFFIIIYWTAQRLFLKNAKAKWCYYSWLIIVIGLLFPIKHDLQIILKEDSYLARVFHLQYASPEVIYKNSNINSRESGTLFVVWILGSFIFLLYHFYRHRKFTMMIKRWKIEMKEPGILNDLVLMQKELRINRKIEIMYSSFANTPMVMGYIKPVIVLPNHSYNANEILFILKHELIHYKRRDIWYKSLVFVASAFNWFNPFIYLMAKEISVQCELSCDEEVVKEADYIQKKNYSMVLISAIKGQHNMGSFFVTNLYQSKDIAKERVVSVLNSKKKNIGFLSGILLLIGLVLTSITFSQKEDLKAGATGNGIFSYVEDSLVMVGEDEDNISNNKVETTYGNSFSSEEDGLLQQDLLDKGYVEATDGYMIISKVKENNLKEYILPDYMLDKEYVEASKGYMIISETKENN